MSAEVGGRIGVACVLVCCQVQGKRSKKTGVQRERKEGEKKKKHMPENQMSECCSPKSQEQGSGAPMEGNRVLFR